MSNTMFNGGVWLDSPNMLAMVVGTIAPCIKNIPTYPSISEILTILFLFVCVFMLRL